MSTLNENSLLQKFRDAFDFYDFDWFLKMEDAYRSFDTDDGIYNPETDEIFLTRLNKEALADRQERLSSPEIEALLKDKKSNLYSKLPINFQGFCWGFWEAQVMPHKYFSDLIDPLKSWFLEENVKYGDFYFFEEFGKGLKSLKSKLFEYQPHVTISNYKTTHRIDHISEEDESQFKDYIDLRQRLIKLLCFHVEQIFIHKIRLIRNFAESISSKKKLVPTLEETLENICKMKLDFNRPISHYLDLNDGETIGQVIYQIFTAEKCNHKLYIYEEANKVYNFIRSLEDKITINTKMLEGRIFIKDTPFSDGNYRTGKSRLNQRNIPLLEEFNTIE